MKIISIILFSLLLGCSCSEEEVIPTYNKLELMIKVYMVDPNAREVLPKDMNSGINCDNYGPGCIRGYIGNVVGYEMIFVEFETPEQARTEAYRVNEFYARNWLLDDVRDEPPLEAFVKKALDGINPRLKKDEGELKTSPEKNQSSPSK